jgi:excisionase family DNA binding protein
MATAPTQTPESGATQLDKAKAVAKVLNVAESTVYELHAQGVIPGWHIGKRTIRFSIPEVLEALKASR